MLTNDPLPNSSLHNKIETKINKNGEICLEIDLTLFKFTLYF